MAELRAMGVKNLEISGSLYDAGSLLFNSKINLAQAEVAGTIGSYRIALTDETTFVVANGHYKIENFGYFVMPDNFDFISRNVQGSIEYILEKYKDLQAPFGTVNKPVIMIFDGLRFVC